MIKQWTRAWAPAERSEGGGGGGSAPPTEVGAGATTARSIGAETEFGVLPPSGGGPATSGPPVSGSTGSPGTFGDIGGSTHATTDFTGGGGGVPGPLGAAVPGGAGAPGTAGPQLGGSGDMPDVDQETGGQGESTR